MFIFSLCLLRLPPCATVKSCLRSNFVVAGPRERVRFVCVCSSASWAHSSAVAPHVCDRPVIPPFKLHRRGTPRVSALCVRVFFSFVGALFCCGSSRVRPCGTVDMRLAYWPFVYILQFVFGLLFNADDVGLGTTRATATALDQRAKSDHVPKLLTRIFLGYRLHQFTGTCAHPPALERHLAYAPSATIYAFLREPRHWAWWHHQHAAHELLVRLHFGGQKAISKMHPHK